MKKIRIGVIFGGRSGEHEVSCASARNVLAALDPARFETEPVLIAKDGRWHQGAPASHYLAHGSLPEGHLGPGAALAPVPAPERPYDVLFPLVHGTNGEDGTLQGLLELADVPYVGCGVLGSAVGMDKSIQKALLRDAGIPVADAVPFTAFDVETKREATERRVLELGLPLFVKPANAGSSVGVSKVKRQEDLRAAMATALRFDRRALAEAAVPEARELEIAVLGNDDPRLSCIGEILPSGEFYDYKAKYVDGDSRSVIPAELPEGTAARIRAMAQSAFRALDLSGMARVDFLLSRTTGALVLNEVNTIPGFTDISMYPSLWTASGLAPRALLTELVRLAIERHEGRTRLERSGEAGTWWLPARTP
ncbi:D-alanine--D-alanine ligase [Patescibacteria group bacterium]|nr:MAG: D-alanine--D-alanine ligase [Patescibacteria group bacterium]